MPLTPADVNNNVLGTNQITPSTGLTTEDVNDNILFSPYRGTTYTDIDPTEYSDYFDQNVHTEFGTDYLDPLRAARQGGGEQFLHMLDQAIVGEIVGGTIEGVGYLLDVGDAIKVAAGEEAELGNWLTEAGQSLRTWAQDVSPIYETAPGKFAPGNWSWWMANFPSVASTLSLMIPAAGTVKGLSSIGKAAGLAAKMGKTTRMAATGISQAVVSRHIENLMEAGGKYEEIYNRNLQNGMSDKEARQNASVAASDIYQKNWVMLAQDIPQYMLLGKSFGKASKAITPGLAKEIGESAVRPGLKQAGRFFLDAASEGGEEAYQYVISERADDLAKSKLDPDYKPRRLGEFIDDDEFWTSVSMGMLGATFMQTAGRAVNNAIQGGLTEDKQRINNVRSYGPTLKMYATAMKDAEAAGNIEAYEEARLGLAGALGGKAAALGNTEVLTTMLEQIQDTEASQETLDRYGIDAEDVAFIKETFPSLVEDINAIGTATERYAQGKVDGTKYDPDIAAQLATLEQNKVRLNERKKELFREFQVYKNRLAGVGYMDLSDRGREIANLDISIKAAEQVQSFINKQLEKELSEDNKQFYTERADLAKSLIKELNAKKADLRKAENYSKKDRENDKSINLDSALLQGAVSTKTKLDYTELSLSKKDDTIKAIKEYQKKRDAGELSKPVEPEPQTDPEVASEEVVDTTVQQEADGTVTENVETKEYTPDPEDVKRRRKSTDQENLLKWLQQAGGSTFNELFYDDNIESIDAINGPIGNTGMLRREGDSLYFYEDNTGKKLDVSALLDGTTKLIDSKIRLLGNEKYFTSEDPAKDAEETKDSGKDNNELQAEQPLDPGVEHPDSDKETEATSTDPDTIVSMGESELVYIYNQEQELAKYLENPNNDLSEAVGTFYIDYDVEIKIYPKDKPHVVEDKKKSIKFIEALKKDKSKLNNLTQEEFDRVPIAINIEGAPGKIFLPRPTNVPESIENKEAWSASMRVTRTNIINGLAKGDKVTTTGFRKDSGHKYNVPQPGAKNNAKEALNISNNDITLGVAIRGGQVLGRGKNNVLKGVWGNQNGGNVYLMTDKTPNGQQRGIKLNKSKLSEDHANIVLKAFQQGVKSFKNKYVGSEVTMDISVGRLLGILVRNGKDTIVTDSQIDMIKASNKPKAAKEYIARLKANQLYSNGGYLFYGENGKINLKNIKPADVEAFVKYATKTFNYSISKDMFETPLSDFAKTKSNIGTWDISQEDIDSGLTFEQHYVKNGWVTTDVVEDPDTGSVLKKPQLYMNMTEGEGIQIEPKEDPKPDPDSVSDQVDDIMDSAGMRFTSRFYEGQRYVRTSIERQIEQVRELISRDVPIEVVDDFIRVVDETGSNLAFGQVQNGAITLYERAEDGTGYHEAYHIVSLYYLTGRQRKRVYDDAAKYYKIDRKDERVIEEALAEDFRKFMLTESAVAPKVKSVRTLFQRLMDFILDIFVRPESRVSNLTVEQLFNKIENGKFKRAKVRNKNLKKYSGYDFLRKVEGFTSDQVNNITNVLMYQMLTKNNIVKLEDIPNMSLVPVAENLKNLRDKFKAASEREGITEEARTEFDRLYNVYDRILEEKTWNKFVEHISDRLDAFNINRKPDVFENSNGTDIHNSFENDQALDGSELLKYDKASYENSGKDNMLANVKLFIATLPAEGGVDPYTQMPIMTDFSESFSKLMKDLTPARTWSDIISILEQKAADDIFYKVLLNGSKDGTRVGLKNAPNSFKHQFEIAMYKHRHNFINVTVDPKTNDHIFVDAAVSKAEKELAYQWSLEFFLKDRFFDEKDNINTKELDKVIARFNREVKVPAIKEYAHNSKFENYNVYVGNIASILNEVGVSVSTEDLQNVIDDLGKDDKGNKNIHRGLDQLINDTLFGFFGTKGVFNQLKDQKLEEWQKPDTIFATDSKIVSFARKVIDGNIYIVDDTVLGAENNTYYVYAQPSLLTEYVKDLNEDKTLIKDLQSVDYNKNSRFIQQIADGKKFDVVTFASYRVGSEDGSDYRGLTPAEDFLLKMHGVFKDLIPLPTLADRSAYYLYKGLDRINLTSGTNESFLDNKKYVLSEKVIDIFYNYAKDEQTRIAKVKAEIQEAKDTGDYSKLVQNMHYKDVKADGTPIFTDDAEGLKFRHFIAFNIYDAKGKFTGTKDISKPAIREALRKNIQDTIEYAESIKVLKVSRDKNGNIRGLKATRDISKNLIKKYKSQFGSDTLGLYHMMAEYTINTLSSTIETEKLITGDPAYFKSVEDKIKRLNAPVAPGEKVIENFEEGEFKDVITYKSAILRSFEFNDAELVSKLAKEFDTAYRKQFPNASDEDVRKAVELRTKPYEEIDVTDAQVYVTPDMYRSLKIRMGEWEDAHQESYELLMSDREDLTREEMLKAETLIMQPLKLVHYGQYFNNAAGVPIYDKMSVAVLLPHIVKGTQLEPLYNRMTDSENPIDMIKYDSAVKVGNTGMIDYFDKSGNPMVDNLSNIDKVTTIQRFKYLRKQQVTDPHITESRLLGTQVKKVVMANLKLDEAIYKIKGSNKKYTGRQVAEEFSKSYTALSKEGKRQVEKLLGIDKYGNINKDKLNDQLRKDAIQSNMPYNVIDNIGEVELDTLLNRKWTESRMISTITKKTIDATTPGTDLIQMSGGGLDVSKDARLDLMDEQGRTEIKISVTMFKAVIPDYDNKTFEQKQAWLKKNWSAGFDGIGYRIPTQGQNSVIPFIIKEFLPEAYGNTIILPYGFTALTGSDFDIDKLFIARYNYYHVGDKAKKVRFFEGEEDGNITNEDTLKKIWKIYVLPKLVRRDNLVALKEKIDRQADKKEALLNAWNNDLDTQTKVDIATELGFDNITQDVLQQVGIKMTYEQLNEQIKDSMDLLEEDEFVKANMGKDAYEVNDVKAVQNRLLDLMFSVLTNEEHILETKTPLDTFIDKLKDMAAVIKGKSELTMLESAAPAYQLQVKDWYMGGGKGIGPFALNNVHHALTQITGYSIAAEDTFYDLGGQIGRDGVGIIDWLSALINANVDIAKDPYIFHLNVNQDTYNHVNLLIRAGYGENTFWLLNQQAVKEPMSIDDYEQLAITEAKKISKSKEELEIRQAEIKDIILKYSDPDKVLNDNQLKDYITLPKEDRDYTYYAKQAGITGAYFSIGESAQILSDHVLHSRIDNKGFGNTLSVMNNFDAKFQKLMQESLEFNNLISNTFLGGLHENSIPFIREIYSGISIESTDGFERILEDLRTSLGMDIRTASDAVYSAVVADYFTSEKGFNLTEQDIKNLFRGDSAVGYRVRNLTQTYPNLLDNKFIQTLKPVYDSADDVWFIKSISGDKNDKFIRDSYTEAWADLLEHPDDVVRKLAEDLMYYAFYTSGFNRSLYSFYQDLPVSQLTKRPQHSDKSTLRSYDEFIRDTIAELNSAELSFEYIDDKVNQAKKIVRNRTLPIFNKDVKASKNEDGDIVLFRIKAEDLEFKGNNSSGQPLYTNMYYLKNDNYPNSKIEYVGYKTDSKEAVYKVIPTTGVEYKGHRIIEVGYEGSIFNDNYAEVSDEVLENDLVHAPGWQDFVYVGADEKLLFESAEEVMKEEPSDVEQVEEAVQQEEDPFEGLTSLQKARAQSLLKDLPQEWVKDEQIRNAIINGDQEETKRIIDQKKKCD